MTITREDKIILVAIACFLIAFFICIELWDSARAADVQTIVGMF